MQMIAMISCVHRVAGAASAVVSAVVDALVMVFPASRFMVT
jgi:hypothetical protein